MKRRYIFAVALLFALITLALLIPIPAPVALANRLAFSDPSVLEYKGRGNLYASLAEGDLLPSGKNVIAVPSTATSAGRSILVYTPPDFDPNNMYPVLYLLHGFAARPSFWVENLLPVVEKAVTEGTLPPLVVVMPDGTIGGNGRDKAETSWDDRGGCWYIDSNLVEYQTFLLRDLPEAVRSMTGLRQIPRQAVIAGSSMGGSGAAYYALKYPDRFPAAALFYPALDLRYAVRGNRLGSYQEKGYEPIHRDNPRRIVNKAVGAGVLGLTDAWSFYPVFDSDILDGPVWTEDLPVWERMRRVNPVDLLRDDAPDLSGSRFFIVIGAEDDFNFDDHLRIALPLLRKAGAEVSPTENIIPKGRHNWKTVAGSLPSWIEWLAETLRSE